MSVYLENMNSLISYDEELLNRLTKARNPDELHDAKCSVLRDFHDIYAFDASENTGCQTPVLDHIGARPPVLNCKRKMNKK